jgi:hypothetical protein
VRADGAADNVPTEVRPVPPPGTPLSDAVKKELETGLSVLEKQIQALRMIPAAAANLPDVEIFHRAIRLSLDAGTFYGSNADIDRARKLTRMGLERAQLLARGQTPWVYQTGFNVLGFVSALDDTVQPYGIYLPPGYSEKAPRRWRLDNWFHGRSERQSDMVFIDNVIQNRNGSPFVRPDALLLQPYCRYSNGCRFAGEADFFEALADVKRRFRVDEDRVVVRGFSLGGTSTWDLTAHFAADWAASAPGAGFSETKEFLKSYQNETPVWPWWQDKLLQLYDAPPYAENFRNIGVVAYSGEKDRQKQATDFMEAVLGKMGIPLVHIIGPGVAHDYNPDSIPLIDARIDALAARGRDPMPRRISLTTPTLKYNRQAWVVVDALEHHWDKALVEAEIIDGGRVQLTTRNVTALSLEMTTGRCPFSLGRPTSVRLDGQTLVGPPPGSDLSWSAHFHREGKRWKTGPAADTGLRKQHGLQGPIDDAFMSSFLMVTPSGSPLAPDVGKWVSAEHQHAVREWKRQFRGQARIKRDDDVTADDIARHNLVLWGDPQSNRVLQKIAGQLPIAWTKDGVAVGKARFPADKHTLIAIYPNPLNPRHYVVLNSGFTYREYHYLNNARQTPKLPDWAVVDVSTPPDAQLPGKIADAGFFGEHWELVAQKRAGL